MENASKALIMAGGLLITMLIIGAATLMYRQISAPEKEKQEAEKIVQIQEFNNAYTGYEKTKLYGSDLISLVNKMIDYNNKIAQNYENYDGYNRMTIEITITNTNHLFSQTTYTLDNISSRVSQIRTIQSNSQYGGEQKLERLVGLLNKLSVNYSSWSLDSNGKQEFEQGVHELGLNIPYSPAVIKDIKYYADYIEFKRKTFRHVSTQYDTNGNGRIVSMTFTER